MKKLMILNIFMVNILYLTDLSYARSVEVVGLRGKVQISQKANMKWTTAGVRTQVDEKGWIKTGLKSAVIIKLSEGSTIKIGANSQVQVRSLKKGNTKIYLKKGSILSKIKKLKTSDRFRVFAPAAFAGVRGTFFYSAVQGTGSATKALFCVKEGAIQVASIETNQAVTVTKGLGTQVAATGPPTPPKPVSWVNQINWAMTATIPISQTPIQLLSGGAGIGAPGPPTGVPSAPLGVPSLLGGGDDNDDKKKEDEKEKNSGSVGSFIRLYGGYGFTALDNASTSVTLDRSKVNWRGGLQIEFTLFDLRLMRLGLGIDAAYIRLYKDNTTGTSPSVINTSGFIEVELLRIIIAQAGVGRYWGVKDFSGSELGFMGAGGLELPIGSGIGLLLMLRVDSILTSPAITTVSGIGGLSFKY